jgi:SPP1 gp7 family putative phage head morphogenesis protein
MWPFDKRGKLQEADLLIDYKPTISESPIITLTEQFKTHVEQNKVKFPAELGEEHPFDFKQLEELYKKFGFFTAVIDKYVDFVVGPGFYIECKDERAKKIIEQFLQDVNFDTILRAWCKEALTKGNGFLELGGSKSKGVEGIKVLNANYIYVVRDNKGNILGYNQYTGAFDKFSAEKVIPIDVDNMAHVPFNVVGDSAYGIGIGYASLKDVDNLLHEEADIHMITNRKANSQLHAQLGKVDGTTKIIPKAEDVTAFGQKMEVMSNKTNWATDALVNFKVIDFGNIGEKFNTILEHDMAKLFYDYQIPPELMGMANIPEGMAEVRMDAFERRIMSIQAEFEKVIEQKIFKRILNANGFEVHVEFQWGEPSDKQKLERLSKLKELMNNIRISDSLFKLIEEDVVKLLDYDVNKYKSEVDKEEQLQDELQRRQPIVPGQNENIPPKPTPESKKIPQPKAQEKNKTYKNYEYNKPCLHCSESYDNLNDINEWLGFNYTQYLSYIMSALNSYDFEQIKAATEIEHAAGYLSEEQVTKLKGILEKGFKNGWSMSEISRQIDKNVGLKDLYRMTEDGKIKTGVSGLPILSKSADKRSMSIARNEVTRIANLGAKNYFKENNITNVRWVSSYGDRTCPDCEALNNQIFSIESCPEIPLHSLCRCTTVPVTEVK